MSNLGSLKLLIGVVCALVVHFSLLINSSFVGWPELFLWPYLQSNQYILYSQIPFEKPPLLAFLLSLGFNVIGKNFIFVLSWSVTLLTDIFFVILAKKLSFSNKKTIFSLFFYILFQLGFEGNSLWFDNLIAPIILVVYLCLVSQWYFLTGVFLSLGLLTKQNFLFQLFIVLYLTRNTLILQKKKLYFGISLILIPVFICGLYQQRLSDFVYWTITFASHVSSQSIKLPFFNALPLIASILFIFLFSRNNALKILGASLLVFIYPRYELFHFQPVLPFFTLCLFSTSRLTKKISLIISMFFVVYSSKNLYSNLVAPNRFSELSTYQISEWIDDHASTGEKILLVNTWDHIYFLSNTLPSTSVWYHQLPWYLDVPFIKKSLVKSITSQSPQFIVSESLTPVHPLFSDINNYYSPVYYLYDRFLVWYPRSI